MPPTVSKSTPLLIVDAVEPCARFWEKLGFVRVAEVPHEGELGFVILVKDAIELMYQGAAGIAADDAGMAARLRSGGSALFVEVQALAEAVAAVEGAPVVMAQRDTFYGMREVAVLDPGGNVIVLAQKISQ